MPPKQAVVTKGYKFKQGVLAKDVIPSICKYPPREGKQFKAPTEFNQEKQIFYQDFESPADWPGDQEASVHNFNLDSSDKFTDKSQSQPQIYHESVLVVNRRPAQFVNVKEVIATKSRLSGRRFSHHEIQMSQFETIQDEIMVFGFSERPETEEEKQERVEKEEAAALANAKGKKDKKNVQEVDNTIQMVKEIKMSNIRIDNELPPLIRWIAGQLQLIKDFNIKDVNNGQSLYQKIYPQKNGFPIYNPNGKYWVKLYFMGQQRKIEIDDRIPFCQNGCLFPRSEVNNEIWSLLLTKAILKLYTYNWDETFANTDHGDGFVMYALNGMISENIPLRKNDNNENWAYINECLQNERYDKKDTYLSFYKSHHDQSITPSNIQGFEKFKDENVTKSTNNDKKRANSVTVFSVNDDRQIFPKGIMNIIQNNVLSGFSYGVTEQFNNEQFNMVYVKERTQREMNLRQKYHQMSNTGSKQMKDMSKEKKLEFRKLKKETKEKIKEEDRIRLDLIQKPPIQYQLYRVNTGMQKENRENIKSPFTSKQVYIAQKCILNKLSRPPNCELPDLKDDEKSRLNILICGKRGTPKQIQCANSFYFHLIMRKLCAIKLQKIQQFRQSLYI